MTRYLIIDHEPELVGAAIKHFLPETNPIVETALSGSEGLAKVQSFRPDVILLDIGLPDCTGLELFDTLRLREERAPVIFITASSTAETAIEAMKLGAFDYLFKPLDFSQFRQIVRQAVELSRLIQAPAAHADVSPAAAAADAMIGRCPGMRNVYKSIGLVSAQDVIVLITGESGTGKELVANAIHRHSRRADKPLLVINSAAIPENLLESEMFGHEKGAFTGADRRRVGKFEQCTGGTLFLDEIGDMPLVLQSKMLRVLQDQTFERVGGNETIRTDVRLIAATNHDLPSLVTQGRFRADLFYRLSVFTIRLPPLRERLGDLPLLADYYLRRFNREMDKNVTDVSPEAMALLAAYSWPGNIREFQSVIKQALVRGKGRTLLPAFLPEHIQRVEDESSGEDPLELFIQQRLAAGSENLFDEVINHVERKLFPEVLKQTGGSQVQAARILGVTRRTLRTRLRNLGLRVAHAVESASDADDTEETPYPTLTGT